MEPQIALAFALLAGTLIIGIMTTGKLKERDRNVSNYRRTLKHGRRNGGSRKKN
jgi:hypothetical protein